jgi:hypothetical protein
MARGWESKSVADQIDAVADRQMAAQKKLVTESDLERTRKRDSLLLSRTRILHDIEAARNPRYHAQLEKSLAVLDQQLAALGNA